MFQRGDMPEPAPKAFNGLGPAPGYTVKRFPSEIDLDAYLRANHVSTGEAYTQKMFLGGVIPGKKEIALLEPGLLRDPGREAAIDAHEFAHTWGAVHHDGKGWYTADGRKWDDLTPAEQQAHLAAVQAPPKPAATYDWSKAFASAAPTTPPPTNAFGEGL